MNLPSPELLLTFGYTILGLTIGSFLNVVIGRVPVGETLMTRSRCSNCGHQIREYDNIPVLSWVLLRGKCRDCRATIGVRSPLVELFTAFGFGYLSWHFQIGIPNGIDFALLCAFSFSIALALIDYDTKRLPDVLVFPLGIITLTSLTAQAVFGGDWSNYRTAIVGAVGFGVFYFLVWFVTGGRGMGFGDVKLAPTLGLLTGWFGVGSAVVGFVSAFVLGGVPLGILMILGKAKKGAQVPFGPFLITGAWVGILFGEQISSAYLSAVGL